MGFFKHLIQHQNNCLEILFFSKILPTFVMPKIGKFLSLMKLIKNTLGEYLKELRDKRTLHEVTMATDIQTALLSRIESGERLPTPDQIKKLAKFYRVSEDSLSTKRTMEKIIENHGVNKITFAAIQELNIHFQPLAKKFKSK